MSEKDGGHQDRVEEGRLAASEVPDVTSREVRDAIVGSLEQDLVGPRPGGRYSEERLPGWQRRLVGT